MSKPLKPKRGTTAENDAYIGEAYEVTLDTEKHTLRVHDGVTPGGHEMASGAALDDLSEEFNTNVGTIREDTVAAAQEAIAHSAGESGSLTLEGVAAEVERKAALDLSNLNAAGRSLGAGLGMPSANRTKLTIAASGTKYTAPANGWYRVVMELGGSKYVRLQNDQTLYAGYYILPGSSGTATAFQQVPARKGESVTLSYTASPDSTDSLYFIYAEGEEA